MSIFYCISFISQNLELAEILRICSCSSYFEKVDKNTYYFVVSTKRSYVYNYTTTIHFKTDNWQSISKDILFLSKILPFIIAVKLYFFNVSYRIISLWSISLHVSSLLHFASKNIFHVLRFTLLYFILLYKVSNSCQEWHNRCISENVILHNTKLNHRFVPKGVYFPLSLEISIKYWYHKKSYAHILVTKNMKLIWECKHIYLLVRIAILSVKIL